MKSDVRRKDILKLLHAFFGSDLNGRIKSLVWYVSNNPLFGGISPKHMVQAGRGEKLKEIIRQQLAGNRPTDEGG